MHCASSLLLYSSSSTETGCILYRCAIDYLIDVFYFMLPTYTKLRKNVPYPREDWLFFSLVVLILLSLLFLFSLLAVVDHVGVLGWLGLLLVGGFLSGLDGLLLGRLGGRCLFGILG